MNGSITDMVMLLSLQKKRSHKGFSVDVPDAIRTHDLSLRRRTLYPAELQKHVLELFSQALYISIFNISVQQKGHS